MPYALCTRTFKIVRVCLAKVNVEKIRWTFTLHIFFFVALAIFSFLKRISTLWHRRHCALKFLSDNLFLHNSPLLWRNDENWFYFFFALKSIICITFFSVLQFVLWKLFLRKSPNNSQSIQNINPRWIGCVRKVCMTYSKLFSKFVVAIFYADLRQPPNQVGRWFCVFTLLFMFCCDFLAII